MDDIKSMFDQGKTSVDDFADYFNKMMKKAILESLSVKYLEKAIEKFYEEFALMFDDYTLTEEERQKLEQNFRNATQGYEQAVGAMQDMFPDIFGDMNANAVNSTANAIKGISENTAGILAGHLASVRVNVAEMLTNSNRSLQVLDKIEFNTSRLEAMEIHLKNINDNLSNSRAYG